MNKFLVALFLGLVSVAPNAYADMQEGQSAVQADFGFGRGGAVIGFEYEFAYDRTYGIGGYFRMYPDDTSPYAPEVTTIGAFVRPHFNRQNWDFFVSPGFGMMFYDPGLANTDDETLLGPSIQYGLLYEMNSKFAFGVDQMHLWSWFGEDDYRGKIESIDTLTLKGRFIF